MQLRFGPPRLAPFRFRALNLAPLTRSIGLTARLSPSVVKVPTCSGRCSAASARHVMAAAPQGIAGARFEMR